MNNLNSEPHETLSSFGDFREGSLRVSEDELKVALTNSKIVLDTNILLFLYSLNNEERSNVMDIFEDLKESIIIPSHVAEEFYSNRPRVIQEQKDRYYLQRREPFKNMERLIKELVADSRGYAPGAVEEIEKEWSAFKQTINSLSEIARKEREFKEKDWLQGDDVELRLSTIFKNNVLPPLSLKKERKFIKEYDMLVADSLSPFGGADAHKVNPNRAGDYIIWKEVLKYVKRQQIPGIIWVSNDTKKDAIFQFNGQQIGLKRQHLRELGAKRAVRAFHMEDKRFLKLAAELVQKPISEPTLKAAEIMSATKALTEMNEMVQIVRDFQNIVLRERLPSIVESLEMAQNQEINEDQKTTTGVTGD